MKLPAGFLGPVFMIGCCALYAATTLMAKVLGQGLGGEALSPLQVSAGRFFFGLLTVMVVVAFVRPRLQPVNWRLHGARTFCGWAGITCLFGASALMLLADATAIGFLSPLITMVLAIPLLGEKVGRWRWSAAAIAVAGAMVIIRPGTEAFQPAAMIALAAALFMGLEAIFVKKLTNGEPPLQILLINNAIGAALAVSAAVFVWTMPSPVQWLVLAGLGATMIGAQTLFLMAMRWGEASFVIPFLYLGLVFSALYDFIVFSAMPGVVSIVGACLIIVGAVVLAWREGRKVSHSGR